jgi:tRNA-uridine 2-sulfurtransferase
MKQRIAIAMSGGIDSSVAAALLQEQGNEVIGLTAKLWPDGSRCCSDEDIRDAQRVCDFLTVPHYVVDLHEAFQEEVINYFVSEYARGRTPSPCAVCNRQIKFGLLMDKLTALDADHMATGHYARIAKDSKGVSHLLTGLDTKKDQTYFLFDLSQKQLARTLFPLGEMTKEQVRQYAGKKRLPVTKRPESQDLCFAEAGEHYRIVEQFLPNAVHPGDVVDEKGKKLGTHQGLHRCTIGQRRGLGIASGKPLYVADIDAAKNTVTVADKSSLLKKTALVEKINWITGSHPSRSFPATMKIRYNHAAAPSQIKPVGGHSAVVTFDEPQFAITPGQIAAFYEGDELLGGGWIEKGG